MCVKCVCNVQCAVGSNSFHAVLVMLYDLSSAWVKVGGHFTNTSRRHAAYGGTELLKGNFFAEFSALILDNSGYTRTGCCTLCGLLYEYVYRYTRLFLSFNYGSQAAPVRLRRCINSYVYLSFDLFV